VVDIALFILEQRKVPSSLLEEKVVIISRNDTTMIRKRILRLIMSHSEKE
jgi:hypothetical protein